jgi:multidrug transporter EmrE-like cation transporter
MIQDPMPWLFLSTAILFEVAGITLTALKLASLALVVLGVAGLSLAAKPMH